MADRKNRRRRHRADGPGDGVGISSRGTTRGRRRNRCRRRRGGTRLGAETVKRRPRSAAPCTFVIVAVGYDEEATAVMLGPGRTAETMGRAGGSRCRRPARPSTSRCWREGARQVVEMLARRSARPDGVRHRTMLILCGGSPQVFERGKPILQHVRQDYVLLGDIGAGQFGKAMNNFCSG